MKFIIKHQIKGRIRIHLIQNKMSVKQADTFQYYLDSLDFITKSKIYEQTADAAIQYIGDPDDVINAIKKFDYDTVDVPADIVSNSGRKLNSIFKEKLIKKIALRVFGQYILPSPVRIGILIFKAIRYIRMGIKCLLKCKLEVSVLDATAIAVSLIRRDFSTVGSVMFLLEIGEILEDWTHKKSVGDLARSMSLNVNKVWLDVNGQKILVNISEIKPGDKVVVHAGNLIPFDGIVVDGEATVNQSSLTGESLPVKKDNGSSAYAGTVVEEGELTLRVSEVSGSTRYEKVISMIEDSEKLKSAVESKAEHLADKLVPYTFLGTALVGLVTRNITKALSVLMVDFSCALKLAMPITVLSAIREANSYNITVKGGKFLEAMAEAKTIVFDKTGTLTKAQPTVKEVIPFIAENENDLLRVAACLEEHFPHSMANAVVKAANDRNLEHEEMHSKVDYIVAHGIASYIGDKRVVIGSYHFVFEDENCTVLDEYKNKFINLPSEYSHLYLAINNVLAAVICIEDPLRAEAGEVIESLRKEGFAKIVMMTGDSERTAAAIASRIGVDEYYSEVLPEDKANFVQRERELGNTVVMIGDGINDSPALSAADVGIAISDGAEIAREIADVTIAADDLSELVVLRKLSKAMMKRINKNYKAILGINGGLILLGTAGLIQPTTSAMLHNTSTLAIGLKSMQNLI